MSSNVLKRCLAATNHFPAMIMLYRLKGWHEWALRTKREPSFAKTNAEWVEETGLTHKQVRDGLKKLRDRGLINTIFKRFGGRPVLHYTLSDRAQIIVTDLSQMGHVDPAQMGHVDPAQMGQVEVSHLGQVHVQKELTEGLTEEKEQHALTGHAPEQTPNKAPEEDMPPFKQKSFSISDVAEGKVDKLKPPKAPLAAKTVSQLAYLWRKTTAEVYDKQVFLLTKEIMMLKVLLKHVAPDQAAQVVETVCRKWAEFTAVVKSEGLEKFSPNIPTMGFFIKHVSLAIDFTIHNTSPADVPKSVYQTSQKAVSAPVKAPSKPDETEYDDGIINPDEFFS